MYFVPVILQVYIEKDAQKNSLNTHASSCLYCVIHKDTLKSDSHVEENFCQIKISPSLVWKSTIICLFGV